MKVSVKPIRQHGARLSGRLLVSMHDVKTLFAGMQRTADSMEAQYLQEWLVAIVPL